MKSLSNLGIGLSLVFGCLLLALVAELYYVLWWKKRITNRDIEEDYSTSARELFYLFCWKKPSSLSSTALNPQELSVRITSDAHDSSETQQQLHGKDFLLKPFGGEESMEAELMRLHNLSGPPRFLFTIKEETKEDLESEDGKSRKGSRSRSLSDLILSIETPYLTPLSSPPFFTPPLTPMENYNHHGFNPLYESSTAAEINRIKLSPPPKFKFLKDAEEKLYRRTVIEEAAEKYVPKKILMDDSFDDDADEQVKVSSSSSMVTDEEDGSFITIFVGKSRETELPHHHHSSSSQVLPLATSPSTIRPVNKKPMFHWTSKD